MCEIITAQSGQLSNHVDKPRKCIDVAEVSSRIEVDPLSEKKGVNAGVNVTAKLLKL